VPMVQCAADVSARRVDSASAYIVRRLSFKGASTIGRGMGSAISNRLQAKPRHTMGGRNARATPISRPLPTLVEKARPMSAARPTVQP
jgi:hypothetical protein